MKKPSFLFIAALLWLPLVVCAEEYVQAQDPVAVIAHPSTQVIQLSLPAARSLFGLQRSHWPNGLPVKLAMLNYRSQMHSDFSKRLLRLYPQQLKFLQDRQLLSGSRLPPLKLVSPQELLKFISETPGALGYARYQDLKRTELNVLVLSLDFAGLPED